MQAMQCAQCAGAIGVDPGHPVPRCLFCGSDALAPRPELDDVEAPDAFLPFEQSMDDVRAAFRSFARSSIWYPSDLRGATLELSRLLVPAWAWRGALETHWAGLVRAMSASGKRPVSGCAHQHFEQVLVPASAALTQDELNRLGGFHEEGEQALQADHLEVPLELSELGRAATRAVALRRMRELHAERITADHGLTTVRLAPVEDGLAGRSVGLPVWIGVFRYKGRPYRILVHGQDGTVVGRAPISLLRVALALVLVLGLVAALVAFALQA